MISILSNLFIKDRHNYSNEKVRRSYGMLCSITGIFLNVILFASKYLAGILSGSVAITADAFNNLSDAGSSFITLIGFKFSGKKPDSTHPFGHGRIEYISGLAVSALIILMGVELAQSSFQKILNPSDVDTSMIAVIILISSICVKIYMAIYNTAISRKIDSAAMKATATDSLSDSIATTVVLLAMIFLKFTNINIDGYCGCLVALFIIFAGFNAARDTLSPLLGQAPDPEFVQRINDIVMAHDEIIGIHDLIVHNYGPGRVMISLHGEVPGDGDIYELHDSIDLVEHEINSTLGCECVIHMDPIDTRNEVVNEMKSKVTAIIKNYDKNITIHDFRMVAGPTHTNLIFDAVIPFESRIDSDELMLTLTQLVEAGCPNCYAVIKIDMPYV